MDDGYDLSAWRNDTAKSYKGRVEVDRLNANPAQGEAVRRIAVDFLMGRIEDGVYRLLAASRIECRKARLPQYG